MMIDDSYESFKSAFFKLANIDLNSYKENQMKRRIDSFIRKHNCTTYQGFIQLLKMDADVYERFVTYLTINVSEFYRNPVQWKTLEQNIFPSLLEKFGNPLRIWSAACSTGDEPYSLAMLLSEMIPSGQFQIIATDLDNEVLQKAKKGYYNIKSIKNLPDKLRDKYLEIDETGIVKVSRRIQSLVSFQQHNLLCDEYPKGIHIIVCRNVLIYFTEEAKVDIYHKFSNSLVKEGILFVGSTEQIINPEQYGMVGIQSFFYEKQ